MADIIINPRWSIQIEGSSPDDLVQAERLLNTKTVRLFKDLLIQNIDSIYVLRSTRWDSVEDRETAHTLLTEAVKQLSGCMTLLINTGPFTAGSLLEVNSSGEARWSTFKPVTVRIISKNPFPPEQFREYLAAGEKMDWLNRCYSLYGSERSWFSAYLIAEEIIGHFGNERKMLASPLINGQRIKDVKRMANSFRHIPSEKYSPPDPPISLGNAYGVLNYAITRIVNSILSGDA